MTLIDKAEALMPCPFCGGEATFSEGKTGDGKPWHYVECSDCGSMGPSVSYADHNIAVKSALADAWNRRALPARGVGVKPEAAETLAKEMQAIVAADRWKGRDLSAAPPEKWSHLRPETQQFWIDTATRILAALEPALAPTDAAQAREAAAEAMAALSWAKANLQALSCRAGNEGADFPVVDRALASLRLALLKETRE